MARSYIDEADNPRRSSDPEQFKFDFDEHHLVLMALAFLTVLVGGLNLAGGVLGLGRLWGPLLRGGRPSGALPPLLVRLFGVQTLLNLLSLLFGTSMLVPSLIPGLAVGAILGANGAVLLYLVRLLVQLDRASSERSAS